MSTVHQIDGGFIQYTKGAPDEVLRLCTSYIDTAKKHPMTEEKRRAILLENKAMADRALRVLPPPSAAGATPCRRHQSRDFGTGSVLHRPLRV